MTDQSLITLGELLNSKIKEKTFYLTTDGRQCDSAAEAQWYQNQITKKKFAAKLAEIEEKKKEADIESELIKYWTLGNTNILKGCFFKFKKWYSHEDLARGQSLIKDQKWQEVEEFLAILGDSIKEKIDYDYLPFSLAAGYDFEGGLLQYFDCEKMQWHSQTLTIP